MITLLSDLFSVQLQRAAFPGFANTAFRWDAPGDKTAATIGIYDKKNFDYE